MDEKDKAYIQESAKRHIAQVKFDCTKVIDFIEIDAPVDYCLRLSCMIGALELCRSMLNHFEED